MDTNHVFVIDTDRVPRRMATPTEAQMLLKTGQAAIIRREPYTLILKPLKPDQQPRRKGSYTLKIDPGSRFTGFAILDRSRTVVFALELEHRGEAIHQALEARAAIRRNRRSRKTRYRQARFDNRTRAKGWLAPSIQHRVDTALTWVKRFLRYVPITHIAVEHVKFDMALLRQDVEALTLVEQSLRFHSIKAYLMAKHHGRCVYCGVDHGRMEIEHWIPRSQGGTDNLTNLVLACRACNEAKGAQLPEVFLAHDPARYQALNQVRRVSLKDAAAVNSTRLALKDALIATDLPVELGSGGLTSYNRRALKLPKAHWIDAACVGKEGQRVNIPASRSTKASKGLVIPLLQPLLVKCMGQGHRQVTRTDRYGFPNAQAKGAKRIQSSAGLVGTGDIVHLNVLTGKYAGGYPAIRIAAIHTVNKQLAAHVPVEGQEKPKLVYFNALTVVRVLQRNDGYRYQRAA